jgi:metallo-beta-lactamase family protein
MDLHFLGGATTVTGSQFLLTTERARILVDCGMFQGSPNESIRNRIPLAYDPQDLDAIVLTHAHLDHCGLIPLVVREGFRGRIHATAATAELAELILLDSGRLQAEFAKRDARREKRDPERGERDDERQRERYEAALDEAAAAPEDGHDDGEFAAATAAEAAEAEAEAADDAEAALRHQPPMIEPDLDEPLYGEDDARAALTRFSPVAYELEIEVAPGIHATLFDAGHILGSAIVRLRVRDTDDSEERVLVFSGDLGRPGTPIIRDPTAMSEADYLLVESTYGGREHEPHAEAIRILAETIRLVAEADGVLLVPSFAVGRTQEIVWELDRLIEKGEIPTLPLYLDSPMASKASDIYRRHPEVYDEETRALLETEGSPLDYPKQIVTRDSRESAAIAAAPRPYMIVASSGMLTGGRVLGHLQRLIDDPSATLLFVGYQGEGTLGAHLQAGAETVMIAGRKRQVRCQVRSISGFSAHADETELLAWIGGFIAGRKAGDAGVPRTVFLVHGDPEAQAALEPKVRALGLATHVPTWHEQVTLA